VPYFFACLENYSKISALIVRDKFFRAIFGVMIMKNFLLAVIISAFLFGSIVMAQSPLDGFEVNVNGQVNAIAVQTDGKILIGGGFSQVNGITRNNLARLNANRTVDTSFDPSPNGGIFAITLDPNGSILVGGGFSTIAGGSRNAIARLAIIGGTLESLDASVNDFVYSIAVDSSGNVLIGGRFTFVDGLSRNKIARLDPITGNPDSFNPDANDTVRAIGIQSNGKILVGGLFTTLGGANRAGLARLNPADGTADSLNPFGNGSSKIYSIVVQPDGNFLIGGEFIGGFLRKKIARINHASGMEDLLFNTEIVGNIESGNTVYSIALQTNGKILVGGFFNIVNNETRGPVTRLNSDGSLDLTFNSPNPNSIVFSIALQSSGKILIGGSFTSLSPGGSPITRSRLAGLERNGSPDKTLDIGILDGEVNVIVPQPDGKIIIAGLFTSVLGVARNKIARLNPDGSLDMLFNPNPIGSGRVFAVALDSIGRVLVGGEFTFIGGESRSYLARLDPITGAADQFQPQPSNYVRTIVIDSIGRVLIGGGFLNVGGNGTSRIARIDPATSVPEFFFGVEPNGDVYSIVEQPDGKILFAGDFTDLATPEIRRRIARVNADGSVDTTFDPDANGLIRAMKLESNGNILLGGDFTNIGSQPRNFIARVDSNGTLDSGFDPNANNWVTSINVQSNNKILVTGNFSVIGGQPRNRVARLNEITGAAEFLGGLTDPYDPNVNGTVSAIAIQADGKILIGGDFSSVGGVSRSKFARLTNDSYAISEITVTRNTVTLRLDGSSPQTNLARFELSTDGGATYTFLGNGTPSLSGNAKNRQLSPTSPQASNFTLTGLNLPTGQDILIRATNSESTIEKVQNAFLLAPTASNSSISGRVFTSNSRGLMNASVSLTDSNGITRTARTNSFGYYRFNEIESGQIVVIAVKSKRYQYQPQVISVDENLTEVNFMPIGNNSKEN
jgi:uncharacterized delta-60 repeat protein